jgi:hypothetical protein
LRTGGREIKSILRRPSASACDLSSVVRQNRARLLLLCHMQFDCKAFTPKETQPRVAAERLPWGEGEVAALLFNPFRVGRGLLATSSQGSRYAETLGYGM